MMSKLFLGSMIGLCAAMVSVNVQASIYENTSCHYANVYEDIICLDKENKQLIEEINKVYEIVKTTKVSVDEALIPSTEYLKYFTESQAAWNKFTTANCQMLNLSYASLQGGGMGLVHRSCWNKAYRNRVNELNSWIAELQNK